MIYPTVVMVVAISILIGLMILSSQILQKYLKS